MHPFTISTVKRVLERQVELWTRVHTKDAEAVEAQMRAMLDTSAPDPG